MTVTSPDRGAHMDTVFTEASHARAAALIREVLARSPVEEDAGHAENTLHWLLRMEPSADAALRMAALGHDIERAREDRLQRHSFEDYDTFKAQHAELGAQIADELLQSAGVEAEVRQEVARLIRRHEVGGDPRSDLLKDADSLSYFDHNLPLYYRREGWDETLRRARWGYQRLSPRAREYYREITPDCAQLKQLLAEVAAQLE